MNRLSRKHYTAIIAACEAQLAGEEGEGDCENIAHEDLAAASEWAKERRRALDARRARSKETNNRRRQHG
jgi:hypothetical protein